MTTKKQNDFIEFSPLCIGRLSKSESLNDVMPFIDSLHLDIMDNTFVQSRAFSVEEINNIISEKPKHVHIMSKNLETYVNDLKNVNSISFHYEATIDHEKIIKIIKAKNVSAGLVIKSETNIAQIEKILPNVDRLVVMAVPPGYSGQKFIESTTDKIQQIRKINNDIFIAVDGGMNEKTMYEVTSVGANSCVVCSVIIKSSDPVKKIFDLKKKCIEGKHYYLKNTK
jgi:ribulose-phosphate 3-epimerase